MKKILLLVAVLLVTTGLTVLSVRHYRNYQNYKNHTEAVAAAQTQKALVDARAKEVTREVALQKGYETVYAQCQLGVAAYNQLPVATKTKVAAPNCGTEIIE